MEKPKISVIVPVYNVSEYLARCVDSIVTQSFSDIEIILVNDGSTDNSGEICDSFSRTDNRIKVIHKQNGGLSDARNVGCKAAKGDFVAFIDSDDFVDREMLLKLYALAVESGADVAVCGICDCYKERKTPQFEENVTFVTNGINALKITLEGNKMPGSVCSKIIKRSVAQKISFRVGKTYEDAFYTPDLFLSVDTVAVTTESLYYYWHRSDSITTRPFSEKAMHVIEAYEYTLDSVKDKYPELIDVAKFRIYWSYFVVLDRILATENYRSLPQFKKVAGYLKNHWLSIVKTSYFTKARRISAIALKISLSLYLKLSKMKEKRDGIN